MSLKYEIEQWVSALEAYDNQDFDKALENLATISDSSKILFNMGIIHATLGEHEDAVNYFVQAIELDQYLAVAYFQCGVSNFLLGDFESALQNFSDALLYLRGNTIIDYDQLGLKFRLYSCEVLFNRGLCYFYLDNETAGMADMQYAAKEKQTSEHDVINDAVTDRGEGYTVFSIPVGVVYRPNESKVRNARTKDYLGQAKLVAAADAKDAFTEFSGARNLDTELKIGLTNQTTTFGSRTAPPGSGENIISNIPRGGASSAFPGRSVRGRPPSQIIKPVPDVPPPPSTIGGYGKWRDDGDDLLDAYARGDEDDSEMMSNRGGARRQPTTRKPQGGTQRMKSQRSSPGSVSSPSLRRANTGRALSTRAPSMRSRSNNRYENEYSDEEDNYQREYDQYSDRNIDEDYEGNYEQEDDYDDRKSRYMGGKGSRPSISGNGGRNNVLPPVPGRRNTQRHGGGGGGSMSRAPSYRGTGELSRRNTERSSSPLNRRPTQASRSISRGDSTKRSRRIQEQDEKYEEGYISGEYSEYDEEEDDGEFEMVTSRKATEMTKVKIKVHGDDTRVIFVDFKTTYETLLNKIQDKLQLSGIPRLRFKDDDGVMVTMSDQDDLEMAFAHAKREARKEAWETGRMEVWCV